MSWTRPRLEDRRRIDHAPRSAASCDAFQMGGIDNALAPALPLPMHGDLALTMPDAHLAGADRHGYPLADQAPWHRVAVGIDLDRTVVADHARQLAIEAVRRIDELFAIERQINGLSADQRLAARRE